MTITLSPKQGAAVDAIRTWWNNGNPEKPYFRLWGYAGTGKSTIASRLSEVLDLPVMPIDSTDPGIMFLSLMGKSTAVLRRKGVPARTIHSAMYGPPVVAYSVIKRLIDEIEALEEDPVGNAEAIRERQYQLKKLQSPKFALQEGEPPIKYAALLIIDEAPMVGADVLIDLLSFNIPILFMGDPGQLPPINGESPLVMEPPDVMLTEVHRQALENPIIALSMHFRESPIIPKLVTPELEITDRILSTEELLSADQVITGHHRVRRSLNNELRIAKGLGEFPCGMPGEKIISFTNDKKIGLMNGENCVMKFVSHDTFGKQFACNLYDDTGANLLKKAAKIYDGHFRDCLDYVPGRYEREWQYRQGVYEMDWGDVITGHKAQGSEWDFVIVYDSGFGSNAEERMRWNYSALTRAAKRCIFYTRYAV